MLRAIAGMIAGCIVITIVVFSSFTGAYFVLGVERIFQPDSYQVSTLWLVLSACLSLCGSILGGAVCAAISQNRRTGELFAGLVLIVLVMFCLPKIRDPTFHVRAGEVSYLDAMRLTQMPVWMHVLTPVLGAVGVLLGAGMKERR